MFFLSVFKKYINTIKKQSKTNFPSNKNKKSQSQKQQNNKTKIISEVISSVGAIGSTDDERLNGETNERAAAAAKEAKAKRFVLVSASKERNRVFLGFALNMVGFQCFRGSL